MDRSEVDKIPEEIPIRLSNWRILLLLGACIATAFIAARSVGVLQLETYSAYLSGKNVSKQEKTRTTPLSLASSTKTDKNEDLGLQRIDSWTWGYDINLRLSFSDPLKGEKEELEVLIKQRLDQAGFNFSSVKVDDLGMSGLYWTPFFKKGARSFSVSINETLADGEYSARFSGDYDFTIYGICSPSEIKKIIAKNIIDRVVKTIKEDFEKK